MSRNANIAKITRERFALDALSLLRDALANGLGAHIVVDPLGVDTHADLFDSDGVVHLTHTLHTEQLALPLAPQAPAPSQPPPAVPAAPAIEAPTARVWIAEAEWDALDRGMQHYLGALVLDDRGTTPVAIDWQGAVGFVWARVPVGEVFDELVVTLREAGIEHHVGDEPPAAVVVDEPPPVAVKPAKKARAKKASAPVAKQEPTAPPAVEAPAAATGLWLLVEHPVGAPPTESRHEEHLARRFYAATVAHGGDGLRRVELFDEVGLLVDSHNYGVPASPTPRGLDGVPASVPAHLRDLAALSVADWWCVVVQQAVRPDLTETKLCTDESTAVATAERARLEDASANSATRIVVFTATGEVHDAWHRWSPVVSAAVEAHPDAELFRISTTMADPFSDVTLWAGARGLAWFASGHQRNSPSEVDEGTAWVCWGRQNSDAVAIIPRALVVLVERRAAGWKLDLRIDPWTASTECSALRVGSRVDVRGEEWRVFLLPDHETATLTRGDDELATVALAEVHPSGTAAGWWAERTLPKKAEKKAPKRAAKVVA